MVGKVKSLLNFGIDGYQVTAEAYLHPGLNKFTIVGLPDRSLNEAKERITACLLNSKVRFPYGQLVVNLLPADIDKSGLSLDLAISVSILVASLQVRPKIDLEKTAFIAGLNLSGGLESVSNCGALAVSAAELGYTQIVVAKEDQLWIPKLPLKVIGITDFDSLIDFLGSGTVPEQKTLFQVPSVQPAPSVNNSPNGISPRPFTGLKLRRYDFEVLKIAAAGNHNLLLDGPPGSGKTTLLSQFSELLPPLAEQEQLEVLKIHSLRGQKTLIDSSRPPFRAPHHSSTLVAMIGGGAVPTPGEVTLAHRGVLLLDELPEYSREVLEGLRQPLSTGQVDIARSKYRVSFPAKFQFLATRNPCPCGWYGSKNRDCQCSRSQIKHYQARVSGPILDRIDMKYLLKSLPESTSKEPTLIIDSEELEKTKAQIAEVHVRLRSELDLPEQTQKARKLLSKLAAVKGLSNRSITKISAVARTICLLESRDVVNPEDVAQAQLLN